MCVRRRNRKKQKWQSNNKKSRGRSIRNLFIWKTKRKFKLKCLKKDPENFRNGWTTTTPTIQTQMRERFFLSIKAKKYAQLNIDWNERYREGLNNAAIPAQTIANCYIFHHNITCLHSSIWCFMKSRKYPSS